jgi:hypothetical protein
MWWICAQMKFCVTYRFFLPKQEQKRDNLLVLSADYPDFCGLDLISLLLVSDTFARLLERNVYESERSRPCFIRSYDR